MEQEEEQFTNLCLNKLGLTEKTGLDGQVMLYPIQAKDKKMEKTQLDSMVKRLYKVKEKESDWRNVNFVHGIYKNI